MFADFAELWRTLRGLGRKRETKKKPGKGQREEPLSGLVQKLLVARTRKFLIPIKYRDCNFFSVS